MDFQYFFGLTARDDSLTINQYNPWWITCNFDEIDGLERLCRQGRHDHEVWRVRGNEVEDIKKRALKADRTSGPANQSTEW